MKLGQEMPENEMVSELNKSCEEEEGEDEEDGVQNHVEKVHQKIESLKNELKSKVLSPSDKIAAKDLFRQLESEYTKLSAESTKFGRKKIAKEMKETVTKLRAHMNNFKMEAHKIAIESAKHPSPVSSKRVTDSKNQAKKDKVMKLVQQNELEYQNKDLPSAISHKIHAKFEQMKDDLKSVSDIRVLKTKLQTTQEEIKKIEKSQNVLEEENGLSKENVLEEEKDENDGDIE